MQVEIFVKSVLRSVDLVKVNIITVKAVSLLPYCQVAPALLAILFSMKIQMVIVNTVTIAAIPVQGQISMNA